MPFGVVLQCISGFVQALNPAMAMSALQSLQKDVGSVTLAIPRLSSNYSQLIVSPQAVLCSGTNLDPASSWCLTTTRSKGSNYLSFSSGASMRWVLSRAVSTQVRKECRWV